MDGRTDGQTQTDRQSNGIAIASTALAMRALRRAVKHVSSFVESKKNISQGRPLPPEILVQTDLPPPDSSES